MTNEQKTANAEFRTSHPIPANETADAKATRLAAEKVEKDAQLTNPVIPNQVQEPYRY